MAAITATQLRKEYSGGIVAVDGIDLAVQEGEVFAFLGPNGAGKTTTVRILTTLLRATAGEATVAGYDIWHEQHSIRRSIGVALQEAGLDGLSTGREILQLQGKLCGLSSSAARQRTEEMLELVGLTEAADRFVKTYSGGMKRRLDLASALVHGPRILFLDEPTEGLDPASRAAVWQEVQRLNQQDGLTVFLTTHYLEEADRLAGRLAIIDHGHIVAEGTPAALQGLTGIREVRPDVAGLTLFVEDGPGAVVQVLRVLEAAGVQVRSVAVAQPSLDEVFLKATGSRLEGAAETEVQDE